MNEDAEVHEPAAVLRLMMLGWSVAQIAKELGMSRLQLAAELKVAEDAAKESARLGLPTIDLKPLPKGVV